MTATGFSLLKRPRCLLGGSRDGWLLNFNRTLELFGRIKVDFQDLSIYFVSLELVFHLLCLIYSTSTDQKVSTKHFYSFAKSSSNVHITM